MFFFFFFSSTAMRIADTMSTCGHQNAAAMRTHLARFGVAGKPCTKTLTAPDFSLAII
jgi:hypothetical protein